MSGKDEDAYAAKYMPGARRVLLRDKAISRPLLFILGLVTLWCSGGAVASFLGALPKSGVGAGAFMIGLSALFALLTVLFTVLRTVVSEGEVQVQYGLWGPRVPISQIRSVRVVPYDWKRFGGWGLKRSSDGTWAYVMNARGDVVELEWTAADGVHEKALFSASNPGAVVAAIEEARAAATRVRVAPAGAEARDAAIASEFADEEPSIAPVKTQQRE